MRKGKQGFKVLAALVAATTICAASATAFAGEFTTTTEYELGTGLAKVTSTVSGIDNVDGEEVAFLVSEGDINNGGKIIYIDQQTAKGTATFTFKTDVENAKGNALVRFGSTKTASSGYTPVEAKKDDTVILPNGEVSFTYDENVGYVEANIASGETAYGAVEFFIAPKAGYVFKEATVDSQPIVLNENSDGLAVYELTQTGKVAINFVFEATAAGAPTLEADSETNVFTPNADTTLNTLTVFGTVGGGVASEYGILVSTDETELQAVIDSKDISALKGKTGVVRKFAAWGANTKGQYAISLTDGGNGFLTASTYYVIPYAIGAEGVVFGNAIQTVTAGE